MENMANYIMRILRSELMVMYSWGCSNFKALSNNEGILFHTNGFKHVGWVKVVYDEGADLFNIFYLDNDKQTQKIQKGIYLDELVKTIDNEVEKTENYDQDVRQFIMNMLK